MLTARGIALSLEHHLFRKQHALLGRVLPRGIQVNVRRHARAALLSWESRRYRAWMHSHLERRRMLYAHPLERGLLSVLTPVWNGSPVQYLKALAQSLIDQNQSGASEWVILDNGSTNVELRSYLESLSVHPWVKLNRTDRNLGIVLGLRLCLERASGRYVLPVDADDWLYPDCLQVVSSWIHKLQFPRLLYTDEDKLLGSQPIQPYFKPDFDPVLLLNSAYIAHLGVIDRETALNLNVYSDPDTEGSADWDLFVRFLLAGHSAAHIPEVVYSWRMHASSTAEDALHKPYIHNSQRAVLQRYLDGSSHSDDYSVEYSPLLPGSADWWLRPRRNKARPLLIAVLTHSDAPKPGQKPKFSFDYPDVRWEFVSIHSHPHSLDGLCETLSDPDGFICFLAQDIESIDCSDWVWEAIGLAELHPETVMVGGRIRNKKRIITAAGFQFGFDGPCGCPDRGRSAIDRGYFAQMFKERSVSAVSTQFAVIRADFLCDLLRNGLAPQSSIPFLGAWAGAYALRTGKRVVYSPFLSAVSDVDWETLSGPEEKQAFLGRNRDLIPDRRFYPRYFSLHGTEAYQIA